MRKWKTFAKWTLIVCVTAVLAGTAWVGYLATTRHPHLDGTVSHPSLKEPVRVVRDDWGVPHLFGENERDVHFALGYVMAQDRLFQMEVMRRLSQGELAEVVGPLAAPIDAVIRTLRLRPLAEEYAADAKSFPPELRQLAEAFDAGINHCMATEPLPMEMTLLGIHPRPFTPVDSLTVAAILPISFAEGLRGDAMASILQEKLPGVDISTLFPGYSLETPVTVMESLEEAKAYAEQHKAAPTARRRGSNSDAVAALDACLARLQPLTGWFGSHLGSNSWVLGPSRSKSGKPILANDPHIAFTNPSVWYEAHLKYGDHELYGHYVPLLPVPLLGHNRDFAWALTMFENDDLDVYREKFQPGNPAKVMYKGEWVEVKMETETIHVRFGKDQTCNIRSTPHGPIITDLLRKLDGYQGADTALSWVWQHVPYEDMLGFYKMAHARDIESFAQGAALITSPGLNISYADRAGNIAWWAAGKLPVRPKHVNSKRLLDGASGNDEILGYLPFDQNPHLVNPENGCIVTANNMSTVKPLGPIDQIQGYWQPSDRAARIKQILETRPSWALDDLRVVQFDDKAVAAADILKPLLEILRQDTSTFSELEKQGLDILTRWDYRHNTESTGAAIYQVYCDALLRQALLDEMGEKLFSGYCSLADHWNFFKYFVHTPDSPFWDNVTTPQRETRDDIVRSSFKEAVSVLKGRCGADIDRWKWGSLHTMEFKHPFGYLPLLGRLFNVGPFPSSGAAEVVNNMLYSNGKYDFDVLAGPSTRRLIDFGDPEHSLTILPTGNSGDFMSPHYGDQAAMFMKGEYREPRLTMEQIESNKQHEILFSPATAAGAPQRQ